MGHFLRTDLLFLLLTWRLLVLLYGCTLKRQYVQGVTSTFLNAEQVFTAACWAVLSTVHLKYYFNLKIIWTSHKVRIQGLGRNSKKQQYITRNKCITLDNHLSLTTIQRRYFRWRRKRHDVDVRHLLLSSWRWENDKLQISLCWDNQWNICVTKKMCQLKTEIIRN